MGRAYLCSRTPAAGTRTTRGRKCSRPSKACGDTRHGYERASLRLHDIGGFVVGPVDRWPWGLVNREIRVQSPRIDATRFAGLELGRVLGDHDSVVGLHVPPSSSIPKDVHDF